MLFKQTKQLGLTQKQHVYGLLFLPQSNTSPSPQINLNKYLSYIIYIYILYQYFRLFQPKLYMHPFKGCCVLGIYETPIHPSNTLTLGNISFHLKKSIKSSKLLSVRTQPQSTSRVPKILGKLKDSQENSACYDRNVSLHMFFLTLKSYN